METLVRKHRNSGSFVALIFVETEGTLYTRVVDWDRGIHSTIGDGKK